MVVTTMAVLRTLCGRRVPLHSGALLVARRRQSSPQAQQWISRLRYGTARCPEFGSWGDHYSDEGLLTRQLYCRALVYASGGSRLARDWIAGSAALTAPAPNLMHLALQHRGAERDVARLREHLLDALLAADAEEADGAAVATLAVGEEESAKREKETGGEEEWSAERVREAENALLSAAPECRCFIYDSMCASLFHSQPLQGGCYECGLEQHRQRIFDIAHRYFGIDDEVLESMWKMVEAENNIKREKKKSFCQAWGIE